MAPPRGVDVAPAVVTAPVATAAMPATPASARSRFISLSLLDSGAKCSRRGTAGQYANRRMPSAQRSEQPGLRGGPHRGVGHAAGADEARGRGGARAELEAAQDVLDVLAHGAGAEVQLERDLRIGEAGGDLLQNLDLAVGQ